jgi:hypothetical protein
VFQNDFNYFAICVGYYHIFPSITHALSKQKRSVNGKKDGLRYTMNARYAIKIEKIPNHLHTYVHNNLKQRILRK